MPSPSASGPQAVDNATAALPPLPARGGLPARLWLAIPGNLRGMLLIVIATLAVTLMQVGIRMVNGHLHPFQIAFFRNLFGLSALIPFFMRYGASLLRTQRLPLHALRGGLNIVSMLMWFTAVGLTDLAQIAAISFVGPLFATLFALLLLKERMPWTRALVMAAGFSGMLIILRPGMGAFNLGGVLVAGSAFLWGMALVVIKLLTRTESSVTITAYMGLFMTPIALAVALPVWQWPQGMEWFWLVSIGVLGTMGQLSTVQAFREADATLVLPLDFTKLIWSTLLGFLIFAEVPDLFTWIGGAVIFSASTYLALSNRR